MMTTLLSGPLLAGARPNELPAVVEAVPSSRTSKVGVEDPAQIPKPILYMVASVEQADLF